MEKVSIRGNQEIVTKENSKTIIVTDMGKCIGEMGLHTKGNGLMESKLIKVLK